MVMEGFCRTKLPFMVLCCPWIKLQSGDTVFPEAEGAVTSCSPGCIWGWTDTYSTWIIPPWAIIHSFSPPGCSVDATHPDELSASRQFPTKDTTGAEQTEGESSQPSVKLMYGRRHRACQIKVWFYWCTQQQKTVNLKHHRITDKPSRNASASDHKEECFSTHFILNKSIWFFQCEQVCSQLKNRLFESGVVGHRKWNGANFIVCALKKHFEALRCNTAFESISLSHRPWCWVTSTYLYRSRWTVRGAKAWQLRLNHILKRC